jgi:phosphate:Na+ symporter
MEQLLSRRFLAPSAAVKQPKYLNRAVMQYPESAVEALRHENERLYEIAEKIIAHGLCIHRDNLYSDRDVTQVVRQSRKLIREDINEKYALNVKALYASILEFISEVSTSASSEQIEQLAQQRTAGARIVEAVKAVKHLQKNLLHYMVSGNLVARDEYDKIRVLIAETLRSIHAMRDSTSEDVLVLLFDEARLALARADVVADGTIDKLIRERRITAPVATSLMNDYGYAVLACRNLLGAAETLFVRGRSGAPLAEAAVSLDEDEIAELADR